MTVSPGFGPPCDQGRMLASTADRERALDVLKAGFAEGRLTREEHEARAGGVQSARTYADLAALTGDLPGGQWFVPSWQPAPWQPAPYPAAVQRANQVAIAVLMMGLLVLFLALLTIAAS
jgi:Domain of unknown function (DUF1707)